MTGNVWEWTVDERGAGRLQGGGWNASSGLGQCAAVVRSAGDVALPEVGARCCAALAEARATAGSGYPGSG